jgi:hypothetical protein
MAKKNRKPTNSGISESGVVKTSSAVGGDKRHGQLASGKPWVVGIGDMAAAASFATKSRCASRFGARYGATASIGVKIAAKIIGGVSRRNERK